jgi:hypothetical protein
VTRGQEPETVKTAVAYHNHEPFGKGNIVFFVLFENVFDIPCRLCSIARARR